MAFPAILLRFIIKWISTISLVFDMLFLIMKNNIRTTFHTFLAISGGLCSNSMPGDQRERVVLFLL